MQTGPFSMSFAAQAMRGVFLHLLASLVVGLPSEQVHERIIALPLWDQALLVVAAFTALMLATLLFAEAGPGGALAMWGALWVLSR